MAHFTSHTGSAGQVGEERVHQPAPGPLVAEQAPHVLVDRVADPRGLGVGRQAGEFRDVCGHDWHERTPEKAPSE